MKTITFPFRTVWRKSNAFTIIELLVVIGIISILAVALLVSLNPAEAQRRARDAQRLKDVNTIQAIMEQYINDGGALTGCTSGTAPCTSLTLVGTYGTSAQPCLTNWTGLSLCTYARTIPVDPANNSSRTCVTGVGTSTQASCQMRYRLLFSASNYDISTMLESTTNSGKAGGDGGAVTSLLEIFSSTALTNTTSGVFTVAGGTTVSN